MKTLRLSLLAVASFIALQGIAQKKIVKTKKAWIPTVSNLCTT